MKRIAARPIGRLLRAKPTVAKIMMKTSQQLHPDRHLPLAETVGQKAAGHGEQDEREREEGARQRQQSLMHSG